MPNWQLPLTVCEAPPGDGIKTNPAMILQPCLQMLVHAGTGGVGLAAIHLGKAGGSTVLATAGSSSKRAYMRTLGVDTAISSRDNSFADAIAVSSGLCAPELVVLTGMLE